VARSAPQLACLDDPAIAARLVTLSAGALRAVLAPDIGGALAAFYEVTPDGPLHWLRPAVAEAFDARDPLRMASFPLLPYCNRIRDARFEFDGTTIDLAGNDLRFAHALHGNAWRRPWRVGARDDNAVDLLFEHEPDASESGDWPFRYRARQRIELRDGALRITLSAQNLAGRQCRSAWVITRTIRAPRRRSSMPMCRRCGTPTPKCCRRISVRIRPSMHCARACRPMRSIWTTTSQTGRAWRRSRGPTSTAA
jgi:hypothetical protein